MPLQNTDEFIIERPNILVEGAAGPFRKISGFQLRDFIEDSQRSLNQDTLDQFEDLKIRVDIVEGEILRLDDRIDATNDALLIEVNTRISEDTDIRYEIGLLENRVKELEDVSSVSGFYHLQPTADFSGNNVHTGGMVFNSDDDSGENITGIKIKITDENGTKFSFTNLNPGEKIEIIYFDPNLPDNQVGIRKRYLFNIAQVKVPVSGSKSYVELVVEFLFSTGDLTTGDLIWDRDNDSPDDKKILRAEIFPSFDPKDNASPGYVDNAIQELDNKLSAEINAAAQSGVTQIQAGNDIRISPSYGTGVVTISYEGTPPPYVLPVATSSTLGGVKVNAISGSADGVVGIGDNSRLTVQRATRNKRGVDYKGMINVISERIPNDEDYVTGQLVYSTQSKTLFVRT